MKKLPLKAKITRAVFSAYAKINLYLDVLNCRDDGYHDLLSVMHTLSLHDDVIVDYAPASSCEIHLSVSGADLPTDRRNLAYRAAEAFFKETGVTAYVSVHIKKRIPTSAGLGGGSSDAAATLLALNYLSRARLPEKKLLALAASLGSDVPFCVAQGTRLCKGRGEEMTSLAMKEKLYAVVAVGREYVSTPRAFAEMDAYYHRFDGTVPHGKDVAPLLDAIKNGDLCNAQDVLYNAFEPVVLPACPQAAALIGKLKGLGAYAVHMSGSGPSVFGLFRRLTDARRAAKEISGSFVATSVMPKQKKKTKKAV